MTYNAQVTRIIIFHTLPLSLILNFQIYCKPIFERFNIWINIYRISYQYMCGYRVIRRRRRMRIRKIILCRF